MASASYYSGTGSTVSYGSFLLYPPQPDTKVKHYLGECFREVDGRASDTYMLCQVASSEVCMIHIRHGNRQHDPVRVEILTDRRSIYNGLGLNEADFHRAFGGRYVSVGRPFELAKYNNEEL